MSSSPKKPSALSYGSPRASPFRRPESPSLTSPSAQNSRLSTPTASPAKQPKSSFQPSHQQQPSPATSVTSAIFSPQAAAGSGSSPSVRTPGSRNTAANSDALSKLNATQVREMRESFQVLDRDDDGQVTRDDVADIRNQLGLDSSGPSLNPYFPASEPSSLNLATYLSTFANLLSHMSRPDELTAAFAAFDVDDSGQIDVNELRDALLNTPPDKDERQLTAREIDSVVDGFTARRTFGKGAMGMPNGKARGEVFRYLDFMGALNGKPEADAIVQQEAAKV